MDGILTGLLRLQTDLHRVITKALICMPRNSKQIQPDEKFPDPLHPPRTGLCPLPPCCHLLVVILDSRPPDRVIAGKDVGKVCGWRRGQEARQDDCVFECETYTLSSWWHLVCAVRRDKNSGWMVLTACAASPISMALPLNHCPPLLRVKTG
jgi:hypothetical protein